MIDLLECRHWIRTYDSAYPVQHVRKAFDDACVSLGEAGGNFSAARRQRTEFGQNKRSSEMSLRGFGSQSVI